MGHELLAIARDRRFWRGAWIWVVLALIGLNVRVGRWHREHEQGMQAARMASKAMFPENMTGKPADRIARFDISCGEDLEKYWPAIPDARRQRLVILSGMSQMHTINEPKDGDQLICQWLDDAMSPKGVRVWGFAAPNLCNEEAVFQLAALLSEPRTRPHVFMYGLCFDKFRNVDLRPGYQAFFRARPQLQQQWRSIAEEYRSKYPAASEKMLSTLREINQSSAQQEDTFESRLRAKAAAASPLVRARKDLNATAQGMLFVWRNTILGIRATSKRPMLKARHEMNQEFVGLLSDLAARNGVQVIFYVIPLNPQAENPYIAAEYAEFKVWAAKFCSERSIPYANFEGIIPADHWGTFMGGPDFKHFKGIGHKMTAEAILHRFADVLTGNPASGQEAPK